MTDEKVVMDKATFKALSVDSRITILKLLKLRRHTLSELAADLSLSQSTVKEHLQKLEEAKLIKQLDEGRKWKYYKLTQKGKNIVDPREVKVMFLFAASMIGLFGVAFKFMTQLFTSGVTSLAAPSASFDAAPLMAKGLVAPEAAAIFADEATASVSSAPLAKEAVVTTATHATPWLAQVPVQEILMFVVVGLALTGIIISLLYFRTAKTNLKKELEEGK